MSAGATSAPAVDIDVRTPTPAGGPEGLVAGYAGVVLEVADLDRAGRFYAEVLGLRPEPTPEGLRLAFGPAHSLTLVERPDGAPRTRPDGGTHVGLGLPDAALREVEARLAAAGVVLHRYHEDRPAERDANRYLADPDGNRLQMVPAERVGIDHVSLEVHDLEWAELFWVHLLGGRVEYRVGWAMQDFVRAQAWGDGQDQCAPGTRRWDKRYTSIEGQARVPRPNGQTFVELAPGVTLGIFLSPEHLQEPPREVFVGTPRLQLRLAARGLDKLAQRFGSRRLRCLHRSPETGAPFVIQAGRLFAKDTGGNFLEFVP